MHFSSGGEQTLAETSPDESGSTGDQRATHGASASKPASQERLGCAANVRERETRTFGDVEQRVRAVGLVQHPEDRQLLRSRVGAAETTVEAALPELRLASRREVSIRPVMLEDVEDVEGGSECRLEAIGADEVEVVGRRVVLRKLALERASETPDGKVEARRVELTLVPAPGDEVESPASAPPDDVVACPIDRARLRDDSACRSEALRRRRTPRPCPPTIRESRSSLRASQVMDPIVPGMKSRR